jgi:hypothetical protein
MQRKNRAKPETRNRKPETGTETGGPETGGQALHFTKETNGNVKCKA